jgi:hypothetical protein
VLLPMPAEVSAGFLVPQTDFARVISTRRLDRPKRSTAEMTQGMRREKTNLMAEQVAGILF